MRSRHYYDALDLDPLPVDAFLDPSPVPASAFLAFANNVAFSAFLARIPSAENGRILLLLNK